MTVNIGLGIGSRDANAVHLERIKQIQSEIVAGGGLNLLVTPRNLYNTAAEFVRNANLKDPALFFTDPGDQLAQPPTSEQEQLQAQQQELMQYQQQLDAQAQSQREQKMMLDYQARMAELEETSKKNADSMMIAMEKLKNDVLDMKLKYGATPAQGA
jgi:hypothetical protein